MNIFFRVFIMIVAMGSIVWVMYKLNTEGLDPALFHLDSNQTSSFNPDDVTYFEWKSTNKLYSYDKDPSGRWLPEKNEKALKDLVLFLSQIQLDEVEQKGASSLEVSLDIDGVRWQGAWDGLSFVWKTGPHAGQGEILNENKNIVFFKGAHIFDFVSLDFCKNRITTMTVQAHGKDYRIEQINRGWRVTQPEPHELDPVFIEKWLIGLCKAKVKTILDLSYAQSNAKQGAADFTFVDGGKISLFHVEKDFFIKGNMGLIIEGLGTLLEDLKKHLPATTNP